MKIVLSALFLAVAAVAGAAPDAAGADVLAGKTPPKLSGGYSAGEVITACREMLPLKPVELEGALIVRNRRGIVSAEHGYRLVMRRTREAAIVKVELTPRASTNVVATVTMYRRTGGAPTVEVLKAGAKSPEKVSSPLESVLETDVTWLDLTFDFLWWTDASFEEEREGETIHGQKCAVILVKPPRPIPGLGAVRLWADKKTGCLMQAEQLDGDMKPLRRLWGTRVKKFGDRWMVSVLETETPGRRRRTKITVEKFRELDN